MKIISFEWDSGNWPKCGKHGVSREEIEQMFLGSPAVHADPFESEKRMRAIGKTLAGRYLFVVFIFRENKLRPISARYMHQKEIDFYENS